MLRKPSLALALVLFAVTLASASDPSQGRPQQSHGGRAIQIDGLTWRPDVGAPPNVTTSSASAITQQLVAVSPKDPKKRVIAGFNEYGGGYHWSSVLEGFDWNGEIGQPGYGKGFLGAIRDQMHRNAYNPEQAGLNDREGVRTKVDKHDGSVVVPQFQMSLFSDGSAAHRPRFAFDNYASEFDFSGVTADVSARFGVPAFMHEEYYAYARSPNAIRQFLQGRIANGPGAGENVFDAAKRVEDVSSAPGEQTPRDTDLSLVVHTIGGIRPPAAFKYFLHRSNGRWVTTPMRPDASGSRPIFCEVATAAHVTYKYADTGRAVTPPKHADCTTDLQLVVFSTSPDPARGTAMALYVPADDALNAKQTHIVNRDSMSVERSEDRRIEQGIFVSRFIHNRNNPEQGYWFAGARNLTAGLLSPDSAAEYYGKGRIEILTDKSYLLFGTPDEIWTAIGGKHGKAEQAFGSASAKERAKEQIKEQPSAERPPKERPPKAPLSNEAYDIVVVAGQSNAVGRGLGPSSADGRKPEFADRVFQLGRFGRDNMQIIPASEPLQNWGQRPGRWHGYKGFAYPFALRLAAARKDGRKVLIIPAARGSTSILQWDDKIEPDPQRPFTHARMQDSTILYDDMLERIKFVLANYPKSRVVAVLWSQGETDVLQIGNPRSDIHALMSSAEVYEKTFAGLRTRLRSDLSSQGCFPILVAEFAQQWEPMNGRPQGMQAKEQVIAAIRNVVSTDPCGTSALVSSSGVGVDTDKPNSPHYSAEGVVQLGNHFFSSFEALERKGR